MLDRDESAGSKFEFRPRIYRRQAVDLGGLLASPEKERDNKVVLLADWVMAVVAVDVFAPEREE